MNEEPSEKQQHLKILSQDHDIVLFFSRRIKEGLSRTIDSQRLRNYVNYFYHNHLKAHFRDEEVLLFHRLSEPVRLHTKREHREIERQVDAINFADAGNLLVYVELTAILDALISYEAEIVFPELVTALSESTLNSIEGFLEKDSPRMQDSYPDKFWQ